MPQKKRTRLDFFVSKVLMGYKKSFLNSNHLANRNMEIIEIRKLDQDIIQR